MPSEAFREARRRAGESRVRQNRERILQTARAAFLTHGYEDARIEHIANEAGVAVATIYNVFPGGKPTLAAAVWYDLYRPAIEAAAGRLGREPSLDVLKSVVHSLIETAIEHIGITNPFLLGVQAATIRAGGPPVTKDDPRSFAPLPQAFETLVAAAQAEGVLRADYDALVLASHIVNSTLHRVMVRPNEPADALFAFVWTMLTDGITAPL